MKIISFPPFKKTQQLELFKTALATERGGLTSLKDGVAVSTWLLYSEIQPTSGTDHSPSMPWIAHTWRSWGCHTDSFQTNFAASCLQKEALMVSPSTGKLWGGWGDTPQRFWPASSLGSSPWPQHLPGPGDAEASGPSPGLAAAALRGNLQPF